jgi:Domain of unknown function (DUF4430)
VSRSRLTAAAAALCAAVAAGCGLGPGADQGDVELTVTRDFGSKLLDRGTHSIRESDTVLRLLDRNADVTTRYGGGFVQSIDGLEGTESQGRSSDWFFYVNGIESPVGAGEYRPGDGDRIWWDYRDWTSAMRVPAVVGSWPEPFVHGFQGDHWSAVVLCRDPASACRTVSDRLRSAGASVREVPPIAVASGGPTATTIDGDEVTVMVGPWEEIRSDADARLLADPPSASGVFADFKGAHRPLLELLNQRAELAGSIGRGGGLVAALRPDDGPPTWVVTGTDRKGVAAAARLVGPELRDHYAVATQPGAGPIAVPVP